MSCSSEIINLIIQDLRCKYSSILKKHWQLFVVNWHEICLTLSTVFPETLHVSGHYKSKGETDLQWNQKLFLNKFPFNSSDIGWGVNVHQNMNVLVLHIPFYMQQKLQLSLHDQRSVHVLRTTVKATCCGVGSHQRTWLHELLCQ